MDRAEANFILRQIGLTHELSREEGLTDSDNVADQRAEDDAGCSCSAIGVLRRLLVVGTLSVDDVQAAAAAEAAFSAVRQGETEARPEPQNQINLSRRKGEVPQLSEDDVKIDFRDPYGGGAFCMVYPVHIREKTGDFDAQKPPFALKRLRSAVAENPSALKEASEDLAHEAKILADLSHENVIELHGVSKGDVGMKNFFIILDALAGTLDSKLEKWSKTRGRFKQFMPQETIMLRIQDVALGIAKGMKYLHSQPIIFRDMKPANIGFDSSGCVKIFDFGLAVKGDRTTGKAGTLRYMAPEVAKGSSYGLFADVFSFAVLLWQIITSRVPFEKEIPTSNFFAHESIPDNKRPALKYVESIDLQALLESSWASNPGERLTFQTICLELQKIIDKNKITGGKHSKTDAKGRHKPRKILRSVAGFYG
mmetsp:Transcript_52969/g.158559  ORF Transcript_52969/g.158559 Transcript_52969/m.158559 type:complete len:424 (-) Transcript_52969:275-1546(-)